MKIALLGPYPPPNGGVQTNLAALRRFLLARGISCTVLNITRFRKREEEEIYYPKNAFALLWHLLRRRYDVLHLHLGGALTRRELALGFVLCSIPWSKAVLTFHSGGYPQSAGGRTAKPWTLRGFIFRRFDAIVAVNSSIAEVFKKFGVASERVHVIAPDAFFAQDRSELPPALAQFYAGHDPVVLSVSGLEPEYDIDTQLRAFPAIRRRYPKAGLAILGWGSLQEELNARIASSESAGHVQLCGDVPHAAALEAMACARVVIRTSLYDGDSIAVREALHLGTPVIATDTAMRPPGVSLVPVRSLEALTARLLEVLGSERPATAAVRDDVANLQCVLDIYERLLTDRVPDERVRVGADSRA